MALPNFADVLWAKMCQRAGGWPVPAAVPALDIDGAPFDADARRKAMGYRPTEGAVEYAGRVAGIMRVYFEIVRASPNAREPLDPMFRMPRLWFWMARMLGAPRMMMASVAPQLIHGMLCSPELTITDRRANGRIDSGTRRPRGGCKGGLGQAMDQDSCAAL